MGGCGSKGTPGATKQKYQKKRVGQGINPEHEAGADPNFQLKVYEKDAQTTEMLKQVRGAHDRMRPSVVTRARARARASHAVAGLEHPLLRSGSGPARGLR